MQATNIRDVENGQRCLGGKKELCSKMFGRMKKDSVQQSLEKKTENKRKKLTKIYQ